MLAALARVEDLDRELAPIGLRAEALLASHGVIVTNGCYSAAALERALERTPRHGTLSVARKPVGILRRVLEPAGVRLASVTKRRGWTVRLAAVATDAPRKIRNKEFVDDATHACPAVPITTDGVDATLLFVRRRHGDRAYFVSKLSEATPLHVFVLVEEARIWIAGADLLGHFARECREWADAKSAGRPVDGLRDHADGADRVRFSVATSRAMALRISFPRSPCFLELGAQLTDESGRDLLADERPVFGGQTMLFGVGR